MTLLANPSPQLKAHFGYRKFTEPMCRVLFLDPPYHLRHEVRNALERTGHHVHSIQVPRADAAQATWIQDLLLGASQCRPDFVLTINHFGFDGGGRVAGLMDELGIPTAVWYVDHPEPILCGDATRQATPYTSVFSWESAWVEPMRAAGFDHVEYLPLAAAPERCLALDRRESSYRFDLSFVGDSLTDTKERSGKHLSTDDRRAAEPAIESLVANGQQSIDDLLEQAGVEPNDPSNRSGQRAHWLGYIQRSASQRWRQRVLGALPQSALTVFGDAGWASLLPNADCRPSADYELETPAIYRDSKVVLNVTNRQMPTAVNQRVFDVPLAGGCLLTDAQPAVHDLFEADAVTTFHEPEEARERAEWLIEHPNARRAQSTAALRAVLERHLYEHRIEALVASMRKRFGA